MAQRTLYVFAHLKEGFVPAGQLTMTEEGLALVASSFAYGSRYLERNQRFEIDPVSLPLAPAAELRGRELVPVNQLTQFGGIRDSAPDSWGRRVIEARLGVPINSLSESDYLLEAGSNRVGALDVRDSLQAPEKHGACPIQSLTYLLEAADRIECGEPLTQDMAGLFDAGSSAGGARPKATVRDETGLLWLAKFPSRTDAYDNAVTEYCALNLARCCGMTVPALKLRDLGGRSVLLIRRFDRYWGAPDIVPIAEGLHETLPGDDRIEHRLPFISGLTLLGADEMDSTMRSYLQLGRAVRRHTHVDVIRQNNRELFMRMVFNIFVSNDDDHLRNHGFVRDPRLGGWRLSPLYDVVPRPGVAFERYLNLDVGLEGKRATLDNALSACQAFTLERPEAVRILRDIWGELRQWRTHFEAFGASDRLIDQLAGAFRDIDEIASPALRTEIRRP